MEEEGQAPTFDVAEPLLLSTAFVILRKHVERALAPWNLTATQAIALVFLDFVGHPIPVCDLARMLIQESPSTSTLVDRMSERGLVERQDDPKDRRKALVRLTDRGLALRSEVDSTLRIAVVDLFSVLSAEQRSTLKEALRTFRDKNIGRLQL